LSLSALIMTTSLATARAPICIGSVHMFVCLSVYLSPTKNAISQKVSNLELWSLLTNYRKSRMDFLKNPLLDP